MIKYVIYKALEINDNYCGVRMITLDAYPNREKYYLALNFKKNQYTIYTGKDRTKISMRYDIYDEILKNNYY